MGKGKGQFLRWVLKVAANSLLIKIKSNNLIRLNSILSIFKKSHFQKINIKKIMQKLQSNIKFSLKYLLNYKPMLKNNKINSRIFIKNFFFILLFLEYFNFNNNFKLNFFLKKNYKRQNKFTFLRSPQRNKNSLVNIKKEHYIFFVEFSFLNNINSFSFFYFYFFKQNFFFFESSIFFLKNINFIFFIKKKSLFLYC